MIEQHDSLTPNGNLGQNKDEGIAIIVNPLEGENVSISRTREGGLTIFLRGDIAIAIAPTEAKVEEDNPREPCLPADKASESPVRDDNGQSNGLVLDEPSSKASAPLRDAETPPPTPPPTPEDKESENKKYELIGNAVRDPYYKARKSGKLIADFTLATHDKKGATHNWRIRAFDDLAERVRDTVRRGQKDVEAVVYGPKYWQQKKKTKEGGWTQETVKGYYAGMVRVPK